MEQGHVGQSCCVDNGHDMVRRRQGRRAQGRCSDGETKRERLQLALWTKAYEQGTHDAKTITESAGDYLLRVLLLEVILLRRSAAEIMGFSLT